MSPREDLQRTVERLTTSLDSLSEVFYTVDQAWRLTYLNHQAARSFGRPPETLQDLGTAVQGWAQEWHDRIAARGVRLPLTGLADLGHAVFHAGTLRRVVLNLVQNALDAMSPRGDGVGPLHCAGDH